MMNDDDPVALAEWCFSVTRYFSQLGPNPVIARIDEAIEKALKKKSVRQLKSIKRDLKEWGRGLSPSQRSDMEDAINKHLARMNVNGEVPSKKELERNEVSRILERGKILNRIEYQILSQHMDDLVSDDDSDQSEIERVDVMLTKFSTGL